MKIFSLAENEMLIGAFSEINKKSWPNFLLEGSEPVPYCWPTIMSAFDFGQLILVDDTGRTAAVANSVPIYWDGTLAGLPLGWDDAVVNSISGLESNTKCNTLIALSITISPDHMGKGLSYTILDEVKKAAVRSGFKYMIVPVRPSMKAMYPLVSMDDYINWKDKDNSVFDPWIRAHIKSGGKILRICPGSMTVKAAISSWENWTGMKFPQNGEYIVPKALNPVKIFLEQDLGLYIEPNVWVQHDLNG
jgi:hypothetical protein